MAISHGFNKTEAATSVTAPVTVNSGLQIVVGTAPVNMLDDPEAAVNTPLLVNTFKEAAAAVGYSSDFAKYTLCEAVSASFQVMGISPIVVVNVLDPANAKHITELSNKTVQVNDGIAEIDETGILLKKLVVKKEQTVLTADEDYTASFNDDGTVSIALVNGGKGDGATALTCFRLHSGPGQDHRCRHRGRRECGHRRRDRPGSGKTGIPQAGHGSWHSAGTPLLQGSYGVCCTSGKVPQDQRRFRCCVLC